MCAWLFIVLSILMLPGCAHHISRKGVMSEELPLTVGDIAEIRKGEENHDKVLEEYPLYKNPKLELYLNEIASDLAEVSTRPKLPYHVFVLDVDEVNVFGGPGGYIYITRGLLNFVRSEAEMAGIIAHEVGHISVRDYTDVPHHKKIKLAYKGLLKGSELAKNSIGTYGTAAHFAVKGIGRAAPYVARHFNSDAEVVADEKAVKYLLKARYDPRLYQQLVERLARVDISQLSQFVVLLNTHPPFLQRRKMLQDKIKEIHFDNGRIEFRTDTFYDIRQPEPGEPPSSSILFEPQLGVRRIDPMEMSYLQREKEEKLIPLRKRMELF